MGLRDALYLLENAGLQVQTKGSGTVRRQSVAPGSAINRTSSITIELS
jgi:cell division protein FtsI (penicillin-binding protein 3)